MDTVLIVLGILLIVVIIFGIYKLATRGTHDTNLYYTSAKSARHNGFKTFLLVLVGVASLIGLIWALSNLI